MKTKSAKKSVVAKPAFDALGLLSPYDQMLAERGKALGGWKIFHAHWDRGDTLDDKYLRHINTTPLEASSLPLSAKQNLTGDLHRGLAYTEDDLRARMSNLAERLIAYGTTGFETCIDATTEIAEDGLLAIRVALELKKKFAGRLEIKIGPNPIFGFKKGSGRFEIFKEAAKVSDFLSGLPEKDDFVGATNRDGRIGFENHIRMVMELGCELQKEVQFHLDQANDPGERGTETLLEGLKWLDQPQIPCNIGPTVWVIHMISPSAYTEERFAKLAQGLLKHNIGLIICPTAALSMRQLRPIDSPTHNSIARVLELIKLGVPIRLGTDNICDVFVPQSDGNMLTEIKVLGHAVRFAIPYVWAKLAAGVPLNRVDRANVGRVLYQDRKVFEDTAPDWKPAID